MRHFWLGVCGMWVLACVTVAHAQVSLSDEEIESQRASLKAEHKALDAKFAAEADACLDRFTTTDCENAVAKRRRTAKAEIRKRELTLNNAVRAQRAREQAERTQEKARGRASTDQSQASRLAQDREKSLQEKQQNRPQPGVGQAQSTKVAPVHDPKVLDERRKAYAQKHQDLEKRRADRDKRLAEDQNPGASLPTPP